MSIDKLDWWKLVYTRVLKTLGNIALLVQIQYPAPIFNGIVTQVVEYIPFKDEVPESWSGDSTSQLFQ